MKILIKTDDYKITLAKGWHHLWTKDYKNQKRYKHNSCAPAHYGFDNFKAMADKRAEYYNSPRRWIG